MNRLAYAIVSATCLCLAALTAKALAQDQGEAEDDPKLTIYLQKHLNEDGINRRKDSFLGFYLCSVAPAKFDKTDASIPASTIDAIAKHSKELGTEPDRTAATDGKGGIGERYIIGALIKDSAVAPVLCAQVKRRFKLDVPLTPCLAHDVKNHRVYVDIVVKK